MGWKETLPLEVRQALQIEHSTLGDFSSAIERLDALSSLATRRAVEAVAREMRAQEEVVELGDSVEPGDNGKVYDLDDKEVSLRVDVAVRATKELVKAKKERLAAQEAYSDKANDLPQRAMVEVHVRHVHPVRKLAALKRLKRYAEAEQFAKENNLAYNADETWEQTQPEVETA